jgi:hypothetical protein
MIDFGTSVYVQLEVVFGNMLQGKDLARSIIADYRSTSLILLEDFAMPKSSISSDTVI